MSIPFWRRPWLDGAEEHYREEPDPSDYDELTQFCMECSAELEDDERLLCGECIAEVQRPPQDDHDTRFMDLYDTQNGDIGDEGDPPY